MNASRANRRQLLKGVAALCAAPAILRTRSGFAAGPIRIGLVTPATGPLAFFAEPDKFVIQQFQKAFTEGIQGIPIELVVKDSQSSPARAANVASELILRDEVSLILSSGGPDTVNPVADQTKINGVPSLSTACPWQSFVMGRGSSPEKGFQNTFLFAFGLEDVIATYLKLWSGVQTNRKVGLLLPNDADGNAWGDPQFGFPPALKAAGYEVIDPGRYTPMADDFSAQIAAFQEAGTDIVMGTMIPPEFLSFWSQAAQKGLRPRIATIGKCLLLPATLDVLGKGGDRLSTELGWHPDFPFRSATTGQTAAEIASAWTASTGRPWVQTVGYKHALLDLAMDVLKRARDVSDPAAILDAIRTTDTETTLGPARWAGSPVANVAKAAMMGGQWHWTGKGFDIAIAANPTPLSIPVTQPLQAL
jgi:branched-chain amino acid transport system substrate-binding protein